MTMSCLPRVSVLLAGLLLCAVFTAAPCRGLDPHYLDTIAGTDGDSSTVNGDFTTARFAKPTGVAIDYDENVLFISEWASHRIRWMSLSTFVSNMYAGDGVAGTAVGPISGSCLSRPRAMLFSKPHQKLFVANHGTAQVRAIDRATSTIAITAGSTAGAADGNPGQFSVEPGPSGFELSNDDSILYVSDTGNKAVRAVAPAGGALSTVVGALGVSGDADGHATTTARLSYPWGLAMRRKRNTLFIFDNACVRQWVLETNMITTFAGACLTAGSSDLKGMAARFTEARNGAWDADENNLYVLERAGHRIRHITTHTLQVQTVAGTGAVGSVDGATGTSQLRYPSHMTIDRFNGGLIVADTQNDEVRLLTPRWKSTVHAGTVGTAGSIGSPHSIVYHDRMLYVSGLQNIIFKVPTTTTPASISIVLGTAGAGGNVDATGAAARISEPIISGVDATGTTKYLYFSSYGHKVFRRANMATWATERVAGVPDAAVAADGAFGTNRIGVAMSFSRLKGGLGLFLDRYARAVRTIDLNAATKDVATIAGTLNVQGSADGTGTSATFSDPFGMAVRKWHTVYIIELVDNRIRHLDLVTRAVTTVSSSTFPTGKGGSTLGESKFYQPGFASFSADQNKLFIPEHGSDAVRAITLDPSIIPDDSAIVETLLGRPGAGTTTMRASNSGGLLARAVSTGVTGRAPGGVFSSDHSGYSIRRISPHQIDPVGSTEWQVRSIAGVKTAEATCVASTATTDGSQAVARITMPTGLSVDVETNSLFMSDYHGNKIRRVDLTTFAVSSVAGTGAVGSADGAANVATFYRPDRMKIDRVGRALYVVDEANKKIRKITIGTFAVTTMFTGTIAPGDPIPHPDGNVYFPYRADCQIKSLPKTGGAIASFVGSTCGYRDGNGATAQFHAANTAALDEARNILYVAEIDSTLIRAVDMETKGVWTVAGVPGEMGFNNGDGGAGRLQRPVCMSISPTGHELYVTEYTHTNIRIVSPITGEVTMMAGAPSVEGDADGTGAVTRFNEPYDTAVHPVTGDVYISAFRNCDVRIMSRGPTVRAIAGLPNSATFADNAVGANVRMNTPTGGGYDGKTKMIFSVDHTSNVVRKTDPVSGATTTVAGVAGSADDVIDGIGAAARLGRPYAAWVDTPMRILYFGDFTHRTLRKMDLDTFEITTIAGQKNIDGAVDGALGTNQLSRANSMQPPPIRKFTGDRVLIFADRDNHALRELNEATTVVTTVLGKLGVSGNAGGVGTNARLLRPQAMVASRRDKCLYLISGYQLYRVEWPQYLVSPLAGKYSTSQPAAAVDGVGEDVRFRWTTHLSLVPDESRLLITDWSAGLLREFNFETKAIKTFSGGAGSVRDGPMSAARFTQPWAMWTGHPTMMHVGGWSQIHAVEKMSEDKSWVAVPSGSWTVQTIHTRKGESLGANHAGMALDCSKDIMYIADGFSQTISTFNMSSQKMTTVFGVADIKGDGAQLLHTPEHLLLSHDGATLFVSEQRGHRIRKLSTSTWSISMVAGSDTSVSGTDDGVGNAARFYIPQAMIFETSDEKRMFVADRYNHAIRAIDMTTNTVSTIAGEKGTRGFRDGPAATSLVAEPMGVAMRRSSRTLYIGERFSHVIRAIDLASMTVFVAAGQPWSDGYNDGVALSARFWYPGAISMSPDERRLFIAVGGTQMRVLDLERNIVETIAGRGTGALTKDGNGTVARFRYGWYIYAHPTDSRFAFAADAWTGSQRLTLLSENGPQVLAGHYGVSGTRFEAHEFGRMMYPVGVVYDTRRNVVYVSSHSGCVLHSVDPNTGQHRLAAGAAKQCGSVNGNALSARLSAPTHMAYHPGRDMVFLSEDGPRRIRTFAPGSAIVGHLAGDGAGAVDHTVGLSVRFGVPGGLECGTGGRYLYVTDVVNHAIRRTHMDTGATDTVAGVMGSDDHVDGIGTTARFIRPFGMTRGIKFGEVLYVASSRDSTAIRRIETATWRVTTVPNTHGFAQDLVNVQIDIEIDDDETSLFVLEWKGSRLQRVDIATGKRSIVLGGVQNDTSLGFGPFAGGRYAKMNTPYAMRKHDGRLFIANGRQHNLISLKIEPLSASSGALMSTSSSSALSSDVSPSVLESSSLFAQSLTEDIDSVSSFDDRTKYEVTTIAGLPGTSGYVQDRSTLARFTQPVGIAIDTQDNAMFVASFGRRAIQKIDMDTNVVSHFAGSTTAVAGTTDATGSAARFDKLEHLTIDVTGRVLYIADLFGHTIRAATLPGAVVSTLAGTPGVPGVAGGTPGNFHWPSGMAIDKDRGLMYVTDRKNCALRGVTISTGAVSNIASPPDPARCGFEDGPPATARFNGPSGVVFRKADDAVYISDTKSNVLRRMDASTGVVTTVAGRQNVAASAAGHGPDAAFMAPAGLAMTTDESLLYITDWTARMVLSFDFTSTRVAFVAGQRPANTEYNTGRGDRASFGRCYAAAVDARSGMLYIADHDLAGVRALWHRDNNIQSRTLTGRQNIRNKADGVGTQATHDLPIGIIAEPTFGVAWVLDHLTSTLREINLRTNAVRTVVGSAPGFADGVGVAAMMRHPMHMDIDRESRTLYIADRSNVRIRTIQLGTFAVATIAGQATGGAVNGNFGTNTLMSPVSIAIDRFATYGYIADRTAHAIRQISLAGPSYHMSTSAGDLGAAAGSTVDGIATAARLNHPYGVTMRHRAGELYFVEGSSHSLRVLSLSTRAVRTLIKERIGDLSGDLEQTAQLRAPYRPIFAPNENVLYIGTPYSVSAVDIQRGRLEVIVGGQSGESSGVGSTAKFKGLQGLGIGITPGTLLGGDAWAQQVMEIANIPEGTASGYDRVEPDTFDTRRNIEEYFVATIAGRLSVHDPTIAPSASSSSSLSSAQPNNLFSRRDLGREVDSNTDDSIGGGFGAAFVAPTSIAILPNGSAAFVTDTDTGSLRRVQLSGSFHVTTVFHPTSNSDTSPSPFVSSAGVDVGPGDICASSSAVVSLKGVTSMLASSDGQTLFMGDTVSAAVLSVSSETGAVTATARSLDVRSIADIAFDVSPTATISTSDHSSSSSLGSSNFPSSYSVKSSNLIFAADPEAHVVHRVNVASGTAAIVVGTKDNAGIRDGAAIGEVLLSAPSGVAATTDLLFIACKGSHSIRRVNITSWTVTTLLGSIGYPASIDGGPREGSFASPTSIALSADGSELFVVDKASQMVRRVDASASSIFPFVTTIAGVPTTSSDSRARSVASPGYLSEAPASNYKKIGRTFGDGSVDAASTSSMVDGVGSAVRFSSLAQIAVNPAENGTVLVLADRAVREISRSMNRVVTIAGDPAFDVSSTPLPESARSFAARFTSVSGAAYYGPIGTAEDKDDLVFVVDSARHALHKIVVNTGAVTHVAGRGTAGSANGVGLNAHFSSPQAVLAAPKITTVFVFEHGNGRDDVRSFNVGSGAVDTVCGAGPGGIDAIGTAARFMGPFSPALSGDSSFILTAAVNNHAIRKVVLGTQSVTTIAGTIGVSGNTDGPALTTGRLMSPTAIVYDTARGIVFIACGGSSHVIRLLELSSWTLSTVAGIAGTAGAADGAGSTATFTAPSAMAFGADGSLLIAEGGHSATPTASSIRCVTFTRSASTPAALSNAVPTMADASVVTVKASAGSGSASVGAHGGSMSSASFGRVRQMASGRALGGVVVVADVDARSVRIIRGVVGFSRPAPPMITDLFTPMAGYDVDQNAMADIGGESANEYSGIASGSFVETIAGVTGRGGVVSHGAQNTARLDEPRAVAFSAKTGAIYFADKTTLRHITARTLNVALLATATVYDLALDGSTDELFAVIGASVQKYDVSSAPTTAPASSHLTGLTNARGVAVKEGAAASTQFVANTGANVVLLVVSGAVTTTYGSGVAGHTDGAAAAAMFDTPTGLSYSGTKNAVFVADRGSGTVRMIAVATGAVATVLGRPYTLNIAAGLLTSPSDVLVISSAQGSLNNGGGGDGGENSDELLVLDEGASVVFAMDLTMLNAASSIVLGRAGDAGAGQDGPAAGTRLRSPTRIAKTNDGFVIADTMNHVIKHVSRYGAASVNRPSSNLLRVDSISGNKTTPKIAIDGRRTAASIALPSGALMSRDKKFVYVADYTGDCIRTIDIRTGDMAMLVGQPGIGGVTSGLSAERSMLTNPGFMTLTSDGKSLYYSNVWAHQVHRLDFETMTAHFVSGSTQGAVEGIGAAVKYYKPQGLAVSKTDGTLFVIDSFNHAFRSIDIATGQTVTRAGLKTSSGTADGIGSAARFNWPMGCVYDLKYDFIYVADYNNNKVRKITLIGSHTVSTLAGHGSVGARDGASGTAQFHNPIDLTMNAQGSDSEHALYVADVNNNLVRRIDLTTPGDPSFGQVTTIAGIAGVQGSVDGPPSQATLSRPQGITTDGRGRVFVTDTKNTLRIVSGVGATTRTPSMSSSQSVTFAQTATSSLPSTTSLSSTLAKTKSLSAVTTPSVSNTKSNVPSMTPSLPVTPTQTPPRATRSRTFSGATPSRTHALSQSSSIQSSPTQSTALTMTKSTIVTVSTSLLLTQSTSIAPSMTASLMRSSSPTIIQTPSNSATSSVTIAKTSSLTTSMTSIPTPTRSLIRSPSVSISPSSTSSKVVTVSVSLAQSMTSTHASTKSTTGSASVSSYPTLSPSQFQTASLSLPLSASTSVSASSSLVKSTSNSVVASATRSALPTASMTAVVTASKSTSTTIAATKSPSMSRELIRTHSTTMTLSWTVPLTPSTSLVSTVTSTKSRTRQITQTESKLGTASISAVLSMSPSATTSASVSVSGATKSAVLSRSQTLVVSTTQSNVGTASMSSSASRTKSRTEGSMSVSTARTLTSSIRATVTASMVQSATQSPLVTNSNSPSMVRSASLSPSSSATHPVIPTTTPTKSAVPSTTPSLSPRPTMSLTPTSSPLNTATRSAPATTTHSVTRTKLLSASLTIRSTRTQSVSTSHAASTTPSGALSSTIAPTLSPKRTLSNDTSPTATVAAAPTPTRSSTASVSAAPSASASQMPRRNVTNTTVMTDTPMRSTTSTSTLTHDHTSSMTPTLTTNLTSTRTRTRSVSRTSEVRNATQPPTVVPAPPPPIRRTLRGVFTAVFTPDDCTWRVAATFFIPVIFALIAGGVTVIISMIRRNTLSEGSIRTWHVTPSWRALIRQHAWVGLLWPCHHFCAPTHVAVFAARVAVILLTAALLVGSSMGRLGRGAKGASSSSTTGANGGSSDDSSTSIPWFEIAAGISAAAAATAAQPLLQWLFWVVRRVPVPTHRSGAPMFGKTPQDLLTFGAKRMNYIGVSKDTYVTLNDMDFDGVGPDDEIFRGQKWNGDDDGDRDGALGGGGSSDVDVDSTSLHHSNNSHERKPRHAHSRPIGRANRGNDLERSRSGNGPVDILLSDDDDAVAEDECPSPRLCVTTDEEVSTGHAGVTTSDKDGSGTNGGSGAACGSSDDNGRSLSRTQLSSFRASFRLSRAQRGDDARKHFGGKGHTQTNTNTASTRNFGTGATDSHTGGGSGRVDSTTRMTTDTTTSRGSASYDVLSHLHSVSTSGRYGMDYAAASKTNRPGPGHDKSQQDPRGLRVEATVSRWWFAFAGYAVCGATLVILQLATAFVSIPWCSDSAANRWSTFGWAVAAAVVADIVALQPLLVALVHLRRVVVADEETARHSLHPIHGQPTVVRCRRKFEF